MELIIQTKREADVYHLTQKVRKYLYIPIAIHVIIIIICIFFVNSIIISMIVLIVSWVISEIKLRSSRKKLKRLKRISLALALRNTEKGTSDYFVIRQLLKDEEKE